MICNLKSRISKFCLIGLVASTMALSAMAQTVLDTNAAPASALPAPAATLWDFVTTGTNYWAAPYSTISVGDHSMGGGIAVGYQVSPIINPVLRLDYFGGQFYMPSLTAQLQAPRTIMGKIPIIPFGIAGIGTPIAGAGPGNGGLVTILGAGAAVKLDWLGSSSFWKHTDLVADYENWGGLPTRQQKQIRLGILIKF
jgi:hypothetical protein